jgi:hypothetical protein
VVVVGGGGTALGPETTEQLAPAPAEAPAQLHGTPPAGPSPSDKEFSAAETSEVAFADGVIALAGRAPIEAGAGFVVAPCMVGTKLKISRTTIAQAMAATYPAALEPRACSTVFNIVRFMAGAPRLTPTITG